MTSTAVNDLHVLGGITGPTYITGNFDITNAATGSFGTIELRESGGVGPQGLTLQAPALGADYTLTMPTGPGGPNLVMTLSATGVAGWATAGGGGAFTESGTNSIYSSGGGNVGAGNHNFSAVDGAGVGVTGDDNICIGQDAGTSLIAGNLNICIGNTADCVAGADDQVVIGDGATSSGEECVCIGVGTSSDARSVSIGNGTTATTDCIALGDVDAGADTICIGNTSSTSYARGDGTIVIGGSSGNSGDAGLRNIFIGLDVADSAITAAAGVDNICIGTTVARTITTGANNIAIGLSSAVAATVSNQIAIGNTAFAGGAGSITIGLSAGLSTDAGASNVFIGNGVANDFGTSGGDNVAIGTNACDDLQTGTSNVCIGNAAGTTLTSGADNVCIGRNSGGSSQSGTNNISIGLNSSVQGAVDNQIAIGNTAKCGAAGSIIIGHTAGNGNDSGDNNIFIGKDCGTIGTTNGTDNTCVGANSGANLAAGDNNVCLGKNAGDAINAGNRNVCVGLNSDGAAGQSDQIAIGNAAVCTVTDSICLGRAVGDGGTAGFFVRHRIAVGGGSATVIWATGGAVVDELADSVSSRRYKRDIRTYVDEKDENFDQIRPVWFKAKPGHEADAKNPDKELIGFIAEELDPLYSEYVNRDDEDIPCNINYPYIVTLLTEKTQRLRAENKSQQAQIDQLLARVSALEN